MCVRWGFSRGQVEGQDHDDRVVWSFRERLGLRYSICARDLGAISDMREVDETCRELPLLAGEAYHKVRREERQGKSHGRPLLLRRWIEGV